MKIILVVLVGFMVACSEQGAELTDPVPLSTEIQTNCAAYFPQNLFDN